MQLRCDVVQRESEVTLNQQRGDSSVGMHRPCAEIIDRNIRLQSSSHLMMTQTNIFS